MCVDVAASDCAYFTTAHRVSSLHHSTKVVLGVLHRIAAAGCAVILSIHQPTSRVFRSFHKVVCLSATGHTLYVGPPMEAVGHVVSSLQLPAPRLPAGTDFSVEDAEVSCCSHVPIVGTRFGTCLWDRYLLCNVCVCMQADFDAALLAALGEEEAKKDVVVNVSAPEAPAGERESSPTMGLRRRRVASSPRADDALSPKLSNSSSSPDLGTLRVAAYRALDDEGEQEEEPATPSAMVNPAELLLDVAANRDASSGLKAAAAFRRTARHTHTLATIRDTCNRCRPAAAPEPSGGALVWVAKFLLLVGRGGRQMRREPMLFWLQVCCAVLRWCVCLFAVFTCVFPLAARADLRRRGGDWPPLLPLELGLDWHTQPHRRVVLQHHILRPRVHVLHRRSHRRGALSLSL